MERFASDFYVNYKRIGNIELLANPSGKQAFPVFLVKTLFYLIFNARRYDVIHFSDAILAPLIPVIRLVSQARISFTVHGLDIVYTRFGYQTFIPKFLKRADKIIAVSNYTKAQCVTRGIPDQKITVIPNGTDIDQYEQCTDEDKSNLLAKFDISTEGKTILLTTGRLIQRKGHEWFLYHVFKKLPESFIYIIAGTGPRQEAIVSAIQDLGLTGRVYLLGRVADEEIKCLYQISDIFVMPNIRVVNDQEGFGIVNIEAGSYGLPVVATNIEGIIDAVVEGKSGRLVEEKDHQGFIDAILNPQINTSEIKDVIASSFDVKQMVGRYADEFAHLVNGRA